MNYEKIQVLELTFQSPGLNPIEMLWQDLKCVVYAPKQNVTDLKPFYKGVTKKSGPKPPQ